jgi:hypothetical protein
MCTNILNDIPTRYILLLRINALEDDPEARFIDKPLTFEVYQETCHICVSFRFQLRNIVLDSCHLPSI